MNEHYIDLLKDQVQIAALAFMACMYAVKIYLLFKKPAIMDRTPKRGDPTAGRNYAFMTIAMPWETQSYRSHPVKYVEFAVFHLAMLVAITSTLIIPYFPQVMLKSYVLYPSLALIMGGFLCGISRALRRILVAEMRIISSFDDYFAIILLTLYMLIAFLAIPNSGSKDWTEVTFFAVTAFFLIYVPFSKISHYVMWPFNRYYVGKHFGKRGVYPKKPGSMSPSRS